MSDGWLPDALVAEARELYTYCFSEEEAFTDWFFRDRFSAANTLASVEDGRVLSTLQMIPYRMRLRGITVPAAYIVGVATRPDARGRGHAGRLMRLSLLKARERGLPVLPLYPFEYDFYRAYGWEISDEIARVVLPLDTPGLTCAPDLRVEMRSPLDSPALYAGARDAALASLSCALERGVPAWESRGRQLAAERGWGAVVLRGREPVGAVLYALDGARVNVDEFYSSDASAARALLWFLCAHRSTATEAHLTVPVHPMRDTPPLWRLLPDARGRVKLEPHAMLRIVDAQTALDIALAGALPGARPLALEVTDRDAPWNNGVYLLDGGRARRTDQAPELTVSACGLASLVSGFGTPELAAARGQLTGEPAARGALAEHLTQAPTFTLEEW